jgi:hypothetical protein
MNTLKSKRRASVDRIRGVAAPRVLSRRCSAETRLRRAAASKRSIAARAAFSLSAIAWRQDIGWNLQHHITGKLGRIGERNSGDMRVKGLRDADCKIARRVARDPMLQIDDNILDRRNAPAEDVRPFALSRSALSQALMAVNVPVHSFINVKIGPLTHLSGTKSAHRG